MTLHNFLKSFDCKKKQKKQVDVTILDVLKAFDTVPHDILLHKMKGCGVRSQLHKWLSSFLKDRMMNVVFEGEHFESVSVESSVPKGTVLGPLMFLCHINA